MNNSSSHLPLQNPIGEPADTGQAGEESEDRDQYLPPSNEDEKPRCEWDFSLSAVISSPADAAVSASDAIGVIEFDHSDTLLATGGIARRIRIYDGRKLLHDQSTENTAGKTTAVLDHATACEYYISTPAKLSSLKWKPGSGSRVIGSADYDGVLTEYDLEKRVPIFERDEHGGRRVWSMDYSGSDLGLGASGSDDGTMQVWDTRCDSRNCVASVQPNRLSCSPVCCVEFNPFGGHLVTVGCADWKIYGYDARRIADPIFIMDGHQKAVTYTRFVDPRTIVSSSIDGCLMMWGVEGQRRPVRTYRGHVNSQRFVGLSVWRNGGLLSCGSEDNHVFVYDMRWGEPIWVHGVATAERQGGGGFVSGVCWRQGREEQCTLVAGDSDGVLRVFEGERKPQQVVGDTDT